jgi:hypothetical protein
MAQHKDVQYVVRNKKAVIGQTNNWDHAVASAVFESLHDGGEWYIDIVIFSTEGAKHLLKALYHPDAKKAVAAFNKDPDARMHARIGIKANFK